MLAQYENINHLLGPTTDWTHPGTLCEELLRQFLRTHLLSDMSVDKGYIYGRTNIEGKGGHCPEIDILIHDTRRFRPVYRMGDFVIVQPEAVLAMIQVKRTLSPGQLNKGIRNVVRAKKHLLEMFEEKNWDHYAPRVFSGVVGFDDKIGTNGTVYQERLSDWHTKEVSEGTRGEHIALYTLPDYVGSLLNGGFRSAGRRHTTGRWVDYECYDSHQPVGPSGNKVNVALQAMLALLTNILWNRLEERPPFAFPQMTALTGFRIP